jgi:hypothetical protein
MDKDKDIIMMTREEIQRYQVIRKVIEKIISQRVAAECLRLSGRQIRRIVRRVRNEGERGVIHGLRGRAGSRRIKLKHRQKILELYRAQYGDFGPLLASEKLLERDGIKINDETLRLWLIQEGIWQARKQRGPQKRSWREPKEYFGQMVQMDGSHHDWLEGRGPWLVLMGYIDDATSKVYGKFYDYEGTQPAMDSLREYIKRRGIPKSIYLDKHSTYKNNQKYNYKDWPFRDKEELTQFGRACKQLGIELIFAGSPQAKGRVERLFKTLQDRLVKELRLEGVTTCEGANEVLEKYLDIFNNKFERVAKRRGNYHRSVDHRLKIKDILSVQTEHPLRNDRTVLHEKQWYQVTEKTRARQVVVYESLSGKIAIKYGPKSLAYKPIVESLRCKEPVKVRKVKMRVRPVFRRKNYWRDGFKLPGSLRSN